MSKGNSEKVINQNLGIFGTLMRVALQLMENWLVSLAKNLLMQLEVTAASATDVAILKKLLDQRWLQW